MKNMRFCIVAMIGFLASVPLHAAPFYAQEPVEIATGNTPPIPTPDGVDPKNFAVAVDIIKAMTANDTLNNMLDAMNKSMAALIARDNPGYSQQISDMMIEAMKKTFGKHKDEMEIHKATIYAQLFSCDELQQMKTFYQSPVGQKMIKSMPEMMKKSLAMDQNIMLESMREMQKTIIDMMRQNNMRIPREMDS